MYEINRKLTWSGIKAGIVVTIALVILLITVLFTGILTSIFEPKSVIFAKFTNVEGLRPGAIVWLYGLEKGYVNTISISDHGALVRMAINKSTLKILRSDASATIQTMGIMGDKFVEIGPGTSETPCSERDTIKGINVRGFDELITSSTFTMAQLENIAKHLTNLIQAIGNENGSVGKLINDSTLYNNLNNATFSIKNIAERFQYAKGTLNRLVNDTLFYANLNSAATSIDKLSSDIGNLVGKIDTGVNNGSLAGALLSDTDLVDSLRQTISSYHSTAKSISKLIEDIKANPKKYFNFEIF
jgi:phospholipid/cholesterol/gamma-HCH transport system substrate-binding protein